MRNSRSRRNKLQRKPAQPTHATVDPYREPARGPEPTPRPPFRQDPNSQAYRHPVELGIEHEPVEHEHVTAIEVEEVDVDRPASANSTSLTHIPEVEVNAALARMVGNALEALAGTQQAVLNGQSTVREILNVVVQDNFNLKDENRKLRDRMLELERALAEYQRREETRKERLEGRLRALEATVAALQQQVAQLVQIQRQQQRRRGWFG
ncbi:MAG TPA: hypothetical protein VNK95_00695 [Caldilineaceae bacterium]|nr:hypothetical protein [Caldilineaceae bacterium]